MNKMKNAAKKILSGFMIVAVAAIMIGNHLAAPVVHCRPKGEDKIGFTNVATIQIEPIRK